MLELKLMYVYILRTQIIQGSPQSLAELYIEKWPFYSLHVLVTSPNRHYYPSLTYTRRFIAVCSICKKASNLPSLWPLKRELLFDWLIKGGMTDICKAHVVIGR